MFLYTLMSPSFYARAAKISLVIFISCLLLYTTFFAMVSRERERLTALAKAFRSVTGEDFARLRRSGERSLDTSTN